MPALKRILALWAFLAMPAWAQPQATVAAVQMPAWLDRNGHAQALAVGTEVRNGDSIRTGDGARAYLKLAEGSTVKLGENAKLVFFSHSLRPQSAFKGALDILAGAFRFTTDALQRVKSREVSIRVGTATAGIRGTDLWGHSTRQEDLVCLIDGAIEIKHAALAEPVAMNVPMTFFAVPRNAAPQAVAAVDPVQFALWARETEIVAGDGAAYFGGKWKLVLGHYAGQAAALAQYDAARKEGFAASIRPVAAAGSGWNYEVEIRGFRAEGEAVKAAARLMAATGIEASPAR